MSTSYIWYCESCHRPVGWQDIKREKDERGAPAWHLNWSPGPDGRVFVCGPIYEVTVTPL